MGPYLHTDSLTGIRDIAYSADGTIYILAFINQDNDEYLYKISSSGSPIIWSVNTGHHSGMSGYYARNVCATSDSGCVISFNLWDEAQMFETFGTVQKYSKTGTLDWSYQFSPNTNGNPPYYDKALHDVIQNSAGNYYATVGDGQNDTLYEFDPAGNIIFQTDTIKGNYIYELANGDLLVQSFGNTLERRNTSGTQYWSVPSNRVLAFSQLNTFIISPAGIQKVNNASGTIVWTKNYPFGISSAVATMDGGFISVCGKIPTGFDVYAQMPVYGNSLPAVMCRVDSMGDTLWTKIYEFPNFGLSCLSQLPSGNLITGGAFIYTNQDHEMFARDYSAFVASLDSMGNGPLQHTSLTWPGNANFNSVSGFVDDALFTGIAMGFTGPPRDTLNIMNNAYRLGLLSDYATDWPDTFNNGLNFKHADFNGDGVVDTNDLALYSSGFYSLIQPFNMQPWRFTDGFVYSSSLPDFRFIPDHDTVPPGGSIRFNIIAGGAVNVDSIYGIAFSSYFDPSIVGDTPAVNLVSSDLGTPGMDLTACQFTSMFKFSGMACRNNHQDVYSLNDTIGIITMTASDTITTVQVLNLQVNEFNALTYHQSNVLFNLVGGTVVIDPASTVSVGSIAGDFIKVFPNPVAEMLSVTCYQLSGTAVQISILNSLGEKVKELKSTEKNIKIPVGDLTNGFYFGSIVAGNENKNFSFVVQH